MKDDHAAFTGSIPEYYDRVLVPLIFAPCADELVARIKQTRPSRILELACGTGAVTTRLSQTLGPSAKITATDLNTAMLEVARSKSASENCVAWRQADAGALPFEPGSFDTVACQFGWMFFPDKARAMREARRVLVPHGRLFYNTWDRIEHCPVYEETNDAVRALFPEDPPRFYEVPFSFYNEGENRQLMSDGGFSDISVEIRSSEGERMTAQAMAEGIVRGSPVVPEIEARKGDVAAVVASIAKRLADRFGAEPFASPMKAVFCSATAPS